MQSSCLEVRDDSNDTIGAETTTKGEADQDDVNITHFASIVDGLLDFGFMARLTLDKKLPQVFANV